VLSTVRLQAADVEAMAFSWTTEANAQVDSGKFRSSLTATLDEDVEYPLTAIFPVANGAGDGPARKGAVDANVDGQVLESPGVHLQPAFVAFQ
jgi:hypothetical protein